MKFIMPCLVLALTIALGVSDAGRAFAESTTKPGNKIEVNSSSKKTSVATSKKRRKMANKVEVCHGQESLEVSSPIAE